MTTGADWLDQARRLMDSFRDAAAQGAAVGETAPRAAGSGTAAGGGDCRWCPLCQAAAVVRGERPEVSAALADVLATAAAALRSFAGEPATGTEEPVPDPDEPEAPGTAPARPVQRIDLS